MKMVMIRRFIFLGILNMLVFLSNFIFGQDSTQTKESRLVIGGGMDVYYGCDIYTNSSLDLPFYVSSSMLNTIDINLAWLDITYNLGDLNFRFVPAIGSYMSNNYKNEPMHFQFPVEASVAYNFNRKRLIRLDAGVLNSPITNETPFSKDQLVYSRSLASENVPYYLCGMKAKFALTKKLSSFVYLVNGWQEISNPNKRLAVIHQLEWKPSERSVWNWNIYAGNEKGNSSDSLIGFRYFSDLFYTYNLDGQLSFTTCVFYGLQQLNYITKSSTYWHQINSAIRYRLKKDYALSMRAEYFKDPTGLILKNNFNAADIFGLTLNMSKSFNHTIFRLEAKYLSDLNGRKLFPSGSANASLSQKYLLNFSWTSFF